MIYEFEVPGKIVGKGRPRLNTYTGSVYTPTRTKDYETLVEQYFLLKYPKFKTSNYTIIRDDLCCEYCYKGAIEDLFEIEGIEIVKGNFDEDYLRREKIIINIKYDPI